MRIDVAAQLQSVDAGCAKAYYEEISRWNGKSKNSGSRDIRVQELAKEV